MDSKEHTGLDLRIVDPEGDVRLIVGSPGDTSASTNTVGSISGVLQILSSSRVLSLASNVFAALFSPKYQEGVRLATDKTSGKKSDPTSIHLYDDNGEALWKLCLILHHKWHEAGDLSDVENFGEVLEVAHKYNCAKALSFLGEVCLKDHVSKAGTVGFEKMLGFAYMLENKAFFRDVTRNFILNHAGSFDKEEREKMQIGNTEIPTYLLDVLTRKAKEFMEEIYNELALVASYQLQMQIDKQANNRCLHNSVRELAQFLEKCHVKLGQPNMARTADCLLQTMEREAVATIGRQESRRNTHCLGACTCYNSQEARLLYLVAYSECSLQGVCWDCWKSPTTSTASEVICQACHKEKERVKPSVANERTADEIKKKARLCSSERNKLHFLTHLAIDQIAALKTDKGKA